MRDKIFVTRIRVQYHIQKHRAKYAVAATAATAYAISRKSVNDWNAFLVEHNLVDEFYAPEI